MSRTTWLGRSTAYLGKSRDRLEPRNDWDFEDQVSAISEEEEEEAPHQPITARILLACQQNVECLNRHLRDGESDSDSDRYSPPPEYDSEGNALNEARSSPFSELEGWIRDSVYQDYHLHHPLPLHQTVPPHHLPPIPPTAANTYVQIKDNTVPVVARTLFTGYKGFDSYYWYPNGAVLADQDYYNGFRGRLVTEFTLY